MMKYGHNQELVAANPIDHGERESPQQDLAIVIDNGSECLGIAHCRSNSSINRSSELKAKTSCA